VHSVRSERRQLHQWRRRLAGSCGSGGAAALLAQPLQVVV
jgi:hypothetical protein